MKKTTGKVTGVNGNMITVAFTGAVAQNEVGYACIPDGDRTLRLMSEIVRIRDGVADLQVFEDTRDLKVGDVLDFSGDMLAAELGPGLLGRVYDGLLNPLPELAEQCGFFLQRGTYLPSLDRATKWDFTPKAATLSGGAASRSTSTMSLLARPQPAASMALCRSTRR